MYDASADRPGSLNLRLGTSRPSWNLNANGYSRCPPVLTDKWTEDRQAYPKDYDFSSSIKRNAFRSSYNQLGYEKHWQLPNTTAKEQQEQYFQRKDYECAASRVQLPNLPLHRSLNKYESALIQNYPPNCPPIPLNSTYRNDYKLPFPTRPPPWLKSKQRWDTWNECIEQGAFKKCKSPFYECDSYRHMGLHRWQDICDFFPNQRFSTVILKVRNPLVMDDDTMEPRY